MTLKKWFVKNYYFPTVLLLFIVAFTQAYFVNSIFLNYQQVQRGRIGRLTKTVELALIQKDLRLLEVLLESSAAELRSISVAICNGLTAEISIPFAENSCLKAEFVKWPQAVERNRILGSDGSELVVRYSVLNALEGFWEILAIMIISVAIILLISVLVMRKMTNRMLAPLENGIYGDDRFEINELERIRLNAKKAIAAAEVNAKLEAEIRIGRQVAHDIKSPLGALKAAALNITNNPTGAKALADKALVRIEGIVNDLTSSRKNQDYSTRRLVGVNELLTDIVTLKKSEYCHKKVSVCFQRLPRDIEINIDKIKVERAISNIINNAVES